MRQIIAEEKESTGYVVSCSSTGSEVAKQCFVGIQHCNQANPSGGPSQYTCKAIETVDLENNNHTDQGKHTNTPNANTEYVPVVDIDSFFMEIDNRAEANSTTIYSQSILTNETEFLNNGQGCDEYDRAWKIKVTDNNTECSKFKSHFYANIDQEKLALNIPAAGKSEVYNAEKPKRSAPRKKCCESAVKSYKRNNSQTPKRSAAKKKCSESAVKSDKVTKSRKKSRSIAQVEKRLESATINYDFNPLTLINNNPPPYVPITNKVQLTSDTTNHAPTTTIVPKLDNTRHMNLNIPTPNTPDTQLKPIETDLSWIEGIKFVREVHPEEYTTFEGLTESFWNNCEFPPDWDDGDFSYL